MAEEYGKKIGMLLLENGLINKEELDNAVKIHNETGKKLGKVLLEKGCLDEAGLYSMLEKQFGIHFIKKIETEPKSDYFIMIPYDYCKNKLIAPVGADTKNIKILISEPTNTSVSNEISFMTGKTVETGYATESAIRSYLKKYKTSQAGQLNISQQDNIENKDFLSGEDSTAVKFVDKTIRKAIEENASDIHFEVYKNKAVLRFRIDGKLHTISGPDIKMYPAVISRIKILSELDISEKRLPQDGKTAFFFENRNIDIRVSIIPAIYGENAVLRILDKEKSVLTLEAIGLSQDNIEFIKKEVRKPQGLFLVTGPTGSGKTTTLYAILQYIKQFDNKILTIEDPVEYQMDGISQVQVHSEIGLTFSSGLRSFLRHDPDIIMVGEIRDKETAEIAIRAALTGHLVLSTIHTNNSAGTITRFIDMDIPAYLLTATIHVIAAQRLVRKICPHCRTEIDSGYIGKGCINCGKTGYSGRTALFEIMKMSKGIKKAVSEGLSSYEIEEIAKKEGMLTLKESGMSLVKDGTTSLEEIEKVLSFGEE